MTAIFRNEARRHVRGSLILSGIFGILAVFFLAVFPAFKDEAATLEAAMPEHMFTLLGFEEIHSIEGFTAGYIMSLTWVLFLGVYFAYLAGGLVARDIKTRKMDLTLSYPVSREALLLQKVSAFVVPIILLSVTFGLVLFGGVHLIGESLSLIPLIMLFVLSVPYLLVCTAVGLLFSVVLQRVETAQMGALGVIFLLWLLDGLTELEPDFAWIGDLSPTRYYDPNDILIHETYAYGDAGILLIAFFVILGSAIVWFNRRDIS